MTTEATVRARDVLKRSNALRPERLDIKLPPISDLMPSTYPTPPTSSEMDKRHSFSSFGHDEDDRHTHDGAFVPSYGPIEDAHAPLFGSACAGPPGEPTASARELFLNQTMSAIIRDFEHALEQHSHEFRVRNPEFHGPSLDDYKAVAQFHDLVRARAPQELRQHPSSPMPSRESLSDAGVDRHSGRAIAPRPLFTASPVSQHSPAPQRSSKRSPRVVTEPSPAKRARVSSTVSYDDDDHIIETPKKRRSTASSSRRRSSGANSPKETKHNRNRSTKEKKSTNYLDYPSDIAPPFHTMHDPMGAAAQCPEHSVANPRNLNQDPLKDELHESERVIAQKLNIDCSYFLCVKRQIFQRYLEHLKTKSFNWNKTAAQQCSNVDVGKTSQIFMFFNRVGWFNEELYKEKV